MNNYINSPFTGDSSVIPGWLPRGLKDRREKVQLKLLCGADLLESFAVPGLWSNDDVKTMNPISDFLFLLNDSFSD